ncbi:transcriptional regulator, MarR family [Beutenbergia cavernae DSM 12333]|uniref:Transcriptional regulator, MarR family n=1 Tax=Beutenbergia cavernae (strain ATCC BAA-8 / DSM 12333 / CCUG 43141 / JCM 11478 / NBRC 16432 / NCIMB 13614 / HKI 0122) TaxID=471853 RepID=C5C2V0_BEUC1|nr:MarR family transcriptional regulator [Beutenbergia cavernae]ACQ81794.1 transcriptional regulator, MarR family [Beutenbergia cavernae DSM 12333]
MARRPVLSDSERETWTTYITAATRLQRAIDVDLQSRSGISASEFEILSSLWDAAEHRLRISELAARIDWERSRVSHLVKRMSGRGLLELASCDEDGRGTWVLLTREGRLVLLRALRGHVEFLRQSFFDSVEPDQREALTAVSRRILDAVEP